MKRNVSLTLVAMATVTLGVLSAQRAAADTDSEQASTEIVALLDKTDCGATPPTITVLGLTIDVSNAHFDGASCDKLVVGQVVEVALAGTTPPLAATEVHQEGGDEGSQGAGQDVEGGHDNENADEQDD